MVAEHVVGVSVCAWCRGCGGVKGFDYLPPFPQPVGFWVVEYPSIQQLPFDFIPLLFCTPEWVRRSIFAL